MGGGDLACLGTGEVEQSTPSEAKPRDLVSSLAGCLWIDFEMVGECSWCVESGYLMGMMVKSVEIAKR